MKILQQIKDEVAEAAGYKNWDFLMYTFVGFGSHVQPYNDEAAKRYAEEALREAAEKVKIKWIDDEYDEERRDMICHPEIDNASILNIIKELK